ncbi:hypothetical protein JD844_026976 [Phrynosoma platyrhinos]|uniref:Uncharacterized protein n=1 Tax=Phrynosoma platyrhinos TaxID=52577 RepID=A0ABQ7SFR8_PHRPL|nr:hypothetical protein JD844_026976 [Phrynosoma platyrhinos]
MYGYFVFASWKPLEGLHISWNCSLSPSPKHNYPEVAKEKKQSGLKHEVHERGQQKRHVDSFMECRTKCRHPTSCYRSRTCICSFSRYLQNSKKLLNYYAEP